MEKKEYLKRFKDIYKNIPEVNKNKADQLIDKLADVLVMMDECKEHLDEEGCVVQMCQGSYHIDRENPWSKVYDNKSKIMLSLIEKLDKFLPDSKQIGIASAGENLAAFVAKGKKIESR